MAPHFLSWLRRFFSARCGQCGGVVPPVKCSGPYRLKDWPAHKPGGVVVVTALRPDGWVEYDMANLGIQQMREPIFLSLYAPMEAKT